MCLNPTAQKDNRGVLRTSFRVEQSEGEGHFSRNQISGYVIAHVGGKYVTFQKKNDNPLHRELGPPVLFQMFPRWDSCLPICGEILTDQQMTSSANYPARVTPARFVVVPTFFTMT